jgi:hypothetical protein
VDVIERIEQGMTTERDARLVARLIARFAAYELALREIAVYGSGHAAWLATQVLAKDYDEDEVAQ